MPDIVLRSNDGADHKISASTARLSRTVASLLQDLEASKGEDAELLIVPIPNVCNCTLKKVLDFCEQQRAFDDLVRASPAAQQPEVTRKTQAWRETYMKVSTDELYHLVMAAHYLDVPGLLGLCTDAMADHIRGKSPSQVRACFGLKPNLSPEEEDDIRRSNLWALS
ncbi:g11004 [Coccomyxa viridis]|uniref:SKP1-like protein n=1 Tax=Coccomyxa viridis TaxID=1274662 RepID=A0ABP1G6Z2_9CHLO